MNVATFHFKSAQLPDLDDMRRFVEESAFKLGADEDAVGEIVLAVNEAVTNILLHGYRSRPGNVEILVERDGDDLVVCLRDKAPQFDPTTVNPPNLSLTLDERPLGGLGVHMMRQFTDELRYQIAEGGGNELYLVKQSVLAPVDSGERRQ